MTSLSTANFERPFDFQPFILFGSRLFHTYSECLTAIQQTYLVVNSVKQQGGIEKKNVDLYSHVDPA